MQKDFLKNEKILVVDDEKELRDIYAAFLERAGYRVITAENPVQAFDLMATEQIFLVISDYKMPKLDGSNFCEMIKERNPDTPVIMISGFAQAALETAESCQYGPDLIMNKPVNPQHIVAEVDKLALAYFAGKKSPNIAI